jgi:iron complex outermembrane recepter protein
VVKISTKASLIASAAVISVQGSGAAYAQAQSEDVVQDAAADEGEEDAIIVVGVRKALETASDIKRESDTFVDSITATDIGAFPDKSVAEALQRVPGVTVSRSAYRDDATHFAAEPSTVLVRGLLQVRSEFNGRDTFSATSSYGLNYSDVSPDLLSGVDTYKNASANMIEGGIAGTVNIRTRLPFDQKGQLISLNLSGIHNNLSGKITPSVSGIYSNRFETGAGEFGILANVAFSNVKTISQGTTLLRPLIFPEGTYSPQRNYVPGGMTVGRTLYDRDRLGISLAGQWENNSKTLLATVQYNKSTYKNQWDEDAVLTYWKYVDPATNTHSTLFTDPNELGPSPFVFGNDGVFQSGVISPAFGWGYGAVDWSQSPPAFFPGATDNVAGTYSRFGFDAPVFVACVPPLNNDLPCRGGPLINSQTRFSDEKRSVEDVSFQLKCQSQIRQI